MCACEWLCSLQNEKKTAPKKMHNNLHEMVKTTGFDSLNIFFGGGDKLRDRESLCANDYVQKKPII